MTSGQVIEWVASLVAGDIVAVHHSPRLGVVHTDKVERRTPTGRIVCVNGSVFKPDGYLYAANASCYRDRCIRPVQPSQS